MNALRIQRAKPNRRGIQRGSMPTLRILLVEDEPLIRLILEEELTDAGFDVRQAASGDEAAKLLASEGAVFELLITDIHMPGRYDGRAVARLLFQQAPLIPVLYISGRPDIFNEPLGANEAFLAKPFLLSELVQIARRLVRQEGAGGSSR
jgi:DNA-binding response OmpR family regulator